MVRSINKSDEQAVVAIAKNSGLFEPDELSDVHDMLKAHLAGELGADHHWVVDDAARPTGVAYFAPEAFSADVWNLYLLAVDSSQQGTGIGAALVEHAESVASQRGGRLLLIETSGAPSFEKTRSFYVQCGYVVEARIRDYYGQGDDKVVFWKSLAA